MSNKTLCKIGQFAVLIFLMWHFIPLDYAKMQNRDLFLMIGCSTVYIILEIRSKDKQTIN